MYTSKGFTLYELLATISIILILTSTAVPALQQLYLSIRAQNLYREIFVLIQYTRSTAAFHSTSVILCPSQNEEHCSSNWQHPLIIFIDGNNNKKRDSNEAIERHADLLNPGEKFVWRAFGSSRYIRFIADGSTEYQSGNFSVCLSNTSIEQIKLYKTGRARKALPSEIKEEYFQ